METETPVQEARFMLSNARRLAADYVRRTVLPGDTVVDATMETGTIRCFCAGSSEKTDVFMPSMFSGRLSPAPGPGLSRPYAGACTLLQAGHETMERHVEGQPSAVMFNLGWLPGAAHGVTTKVETTLAARPGGAAADHAGGIVTLCMYPGHEEGDRERMALVSWAKALPVRSFSVLHHVFPNAPDRTPQLLLIQKNR